MNLFFNPSLKELRNMLRDIENHESEHDVVVDYDGEVLVDPQLQQPELDLDKFKFRIRLNELNTAAASGKSGLFQNLFRHLMNAWNNTNGSELNIA
jgi:hypothetical protein